jgi:hypothetical protein
MSSIATLPLVTASLIMGLILRKHSLHLEQHLFLGTRAQGLLHEDDLASIPDKFLYQHHLIRVTTCEAVRCRHENDLKRPFGCEIP